MEGAGGGAAVGSIPGALSLARFAMTMGAFMPNCALVISRGFNNLHLAMFEWAVKEVARMLMVDSL